MLSIRGQEADTETWKRFNEKELTHSMAHYLQAVASLKREKGYAKVSDIACRLGVSRAGVTSMLRSLKTRGLVAHERYGLVELTDEGSRFARMTETNREVLSQFFTNILGLPSEMANEDACMIEHLGSAGGPGQQPGGEPEPGDSHLSPDQRSTRPQRHRGPGQLRRGVPRYAADDELRSMLSESYA